MYTNQTEKESVAAWGGQLRGVGGQYYKRCMQKAFGWGGHIHYFDSSDGFTAMYICQ